MVLDTRPMNDQWAIRRPLMLRDSEFAKKLHVGAEPSTSGLQHSDREAPSWNALTGGV